MRRLARWAIVGIVVFWFGGFPRPGEAESRLHLVIATDDQDQSIGHHCFHDGLNFRNLFYSNVDNRRLSTRRVAAEGLFVHAEKFGSRAVLDKIATLTVRPDDALVVYYSGHGAYNEKLGHFFSVAGGNEVLTRSSVVEAIHRKSPRLGVLISDCCYSYFPVERYTPSVYQTRSDETSPLFHRLFFETKGFADITSSKEGQVSMCYQHPVAGSLFTGALRQVLGDHRQRRLSWGEVFDKVKPLTARSFSELFPEGIEVPERGFQTGLQRTQTPYAFSLPGRPVPNRRDGGPQGPRLGASAVDEVGGGVRVVQVLPDFPASQAGLQVDDVILRINGQLIRNSRDYSNAVDGSNRQMEITFRDGRTRQVRTVMIRLKY
ncbi:caspase family protein [Planctomycetota bacterium]